LGIGLWVAAGMKTAAVGDKCCDGAALSDDDAECADEVDIESGSTVRS